MPLPPSHCCSLPSMTETPNHNNNSLGISFFDKYCISLKNSVYLKSLIDILMRSAPQAMFLVSNGSQSTLHDASNATCLPSRSQLPFWERNFWNGLVRALACVLP